jgi:hypothetical protein
MASLWREFSLNLIKRVSVRFDPLQPVHAHAIGQKHAL